MPTIDAVPGVLKGMTRDGWLLFFTRFMRLFAYGSLSVVLVFYLIALGLSESQTGLLLTLTLAGDVVVSLYLTTRADRIGRRRMLIVGAILMAAAGLAFACTKNLLLLIIAGTIGVISPSGNEVGPFLSIDQAALSHVVSQRSRTEVFAWYALTGSVATAMGALFGGTVTHALQRSTLTPVGTYRVVVVLYAVLGVMLAYAFTRLSPAAEVSLPQEGSALPGTIGSFFGIGHSHRVVMKLSSLFALDSFAGGFVVQSFAAYWFYLRFGVNPGTLGVIFFWANIFAGISALLASRLASRLGLVNTMVFTHLPSSLCLVVIPFVPDVRIVLALLLFRAALSQMDVPTRSAYVMAVVTPPERPAAASFTAVPRSLASAVSPALAGALFAGGWIAAPLVACGLLKITYDLVLWRACRGHPLDGSK